MGMKWIFRDQGHAEDVLMWWSYQYYVKGVSIIPDAEYDEFTASVRQQWSVSYASHEVGSSCGSGLPLLHQGG